MIVGPVLWVALLQAVVDLCCLFQASQLQQQLSCVQKKSKRTSTAAQRSKRSGQRSAGPTSRLLHSQLVADLLLIVGQMLQSLLVQARFPQNLVLVQQQLAVLVIYFVWRRLQKTKPHNNTPSPQGESAASRQNLTCCVFLNSSMIFAAIS